MYAWVTSLTADFIVRVITRCPLCQEFFFLSPNPSTSLHILRPDNSGPGTHQHPLRCPRLAGLPCSDSHTFAPVIVHVHFSVKTGAWVLITEPVQGVEYSRCPIYACCVDNDWMDGKLIDSELGKNLLSCPGSLFSTREVCRWPFLRLIILVFQSSSFKIAPVLCSRSSISPGETIPLPVSHP